MEYIWSLLDRWFFGPEASRPTWAGLGLRLLRYPGAVARDLAEGEISLRAMGLVYTTLLSLVPLIAFLLLTLSILGAKHELEPIILSFFSPLGEQGARQLTTNVMQFASRVASLPVVGSLGFVLLAWTVVGTIKRVEDSFNFVWHIEQSRSLARRLVEYLTLLVIGPLLLATFISLSHDAQASAPVQEVVKVPLFSRMLTTLTPHVLVSAFFTGLYLLIPNTRVHWRPAVLGGLVAGVLWVVVGNVFTAFVASSVRTTAVYAGFAVIIAALLWTYLGWLILLAGAQLAFYIQNPSYLRIGTRRLSLSCEEREQLALAVMYMVGQAHLRGGTLWTQADLAAELDVPGVALSHMADALMRAGLLLSTTDGLLVPARDVSHIQALEVIAAARHEGGGALRPAVPIPAIEQLLATLADAQRHRLGELSLKDLVEEPRAVVLTPGRARPGKGG